jgi:hypothetical protein
MKRKLYVEIRTSDMAVSFSICCTVKKYTRNPSNKETNISRKNL